jgi:hypothetical protein
MTFIQGLHKSTRLPLVVAILIAVVHGLVYLFLMPAWQHYDEPNHFEYVWLLAHRGHIPQVGDYDQSMRLQVAESMIAHGFFKDMGFVSDLTVQDRPIWIGDFNQLDEPVVYYFLASLPVRLLGSQAIDVQLYAARFVSWALYLISIVAAYGFVSELTDSNNPLRWLVPVTLALIPGYADLMTAVNNDVAAVAGVSVFLWGAVRLIRRGMVWWVILWTVAAAILCTQIKQSSFIAVPLLFVALLFVILRQGAWRKIAWGILVGGIVIGVVAVFSWGDAALWLRNTDQQLPVRSINSEAPLGNHAIQLEAIPPGQSAETYQLYQLLPSSRLKELKGKTVTVSAWMWSDQPVLASSPILSIVRADQTISDTRQDVEISTIPKFIAFVAQIPEDATSIRLTFVSKIQGEAGMIYYDGLVMAEGEFPSGEIPQWENIAGVSGNWGGKTFENLLRNASGESSWPRVRPWVDRLGARFLPDNGRPSEILYSILDRDGAGWYYLATIKNMLRTFWGQFGWGHVRLIGHYSYWIPAFATALGLVGFVASFLYGIGRRQLRNWPWDVIVFLGITLLAVWGLAIIRGTFYLIYWPFIPSARYAYPAIFPTLLVLCIGWSFISREIGNRSHVADSMKISLYGLFFLGFDILSIVSIVQYYTR